MTTAEAVQQALCGVRDPLLGQNLVDLGMVQAVRVARGGRVTVQVTLPTLHWPATDELVRKISAAVAILPGVVAVDVQPVDDPRWTPYRMSPELKAPLGLPDDEPPAPFPPAPSASSRVQRLLQRLRSR
ncbi:MAG TPA: iron-sulfur cluster assembly protein [Anaerolineae bacterium]|nr:iron-sulfur cluster assembly protein [Anaerolineae bacterium]